MNLIRAFFKPSDDNLSDKNAFYLADKVIELQEKVKELQKENELLKNSMLEIENRVTAIKPVVYNIKNHDDDCGLTNYGLGDK